MFIGLRVNSRSPFSIAVLMFTKMYAKTSDFLTNLSINILYLQQ